MGCSKSKDGQEQVVTGNDGFSDAPKVSLAICCESGSFSADEILQVLVPAGSKIRDVKRQLQETYGLPTATASLKLTPDAPPLADDSVLENGVELLHFSTAAGLVG